MSVILGPRGGFTSNVLVDNEDRLQDPTIYNLRPIMHGQNTFGKFGFGFYDTWTKPQYHGLSTRGPTTIADTSPQNYTMFPYSRRLGGNQDRVLVQGQVINTANGGVAGVTVNLYDSPTNVLVDTVITDANGFYTASSPYSTNAFAVAYNSSQGTAGTTVNTIPA